MGKFLRENAAVVVGIGLPVAVVSLFLLASHLPALWTEPPRHDFVLEVQHGAVRYPNPFVRVDFSVEGERLRARLYKIDPEDPGRSLVVVPPPQQLLVWSHESGALREVEVAIPADLDGIENGAELPLGELGERRIGTSLAAPDGYVYASEDGRGEGVFGLFFGARDRHAVLEKDGARVAVELPPGVGPWNLQFLGWVLE